MGNPKHRKSHSKTHRGRANKSLKAPAASTCSHCGATKLPHRVCPNCGYYNGVAVLSRED
ncbi:50S ribosomal protein L32 [bacterium]|nr:50S ribosomal protein L32 [bacterium]